MDGSVPNLRRHLAGLFAGVIDLGEFQRWFWENYNAIEQQGGDEDADLLLHVLNRLAEYTSDYIDATELLEALSADPLVQKKFLTRHSAVA